MNLQSSQLHAFLLSCILASHTPPTLTFSNKIRQMFMPHNSSEQNFFKKTLSVVRNAVRNNFKLTAASATALIGATAAYCGSGSTASTTFGSSSIKPALLPILSARNNGPATKSASGSHTNNSTSYASSAHQFEMKASAVAEHVAPALPAQNNRSQFSAKQKENNFFEQQQILRKQHEQQLMLCSNALEKQTLQDNFEQQQNAAYDAYARHLEMEAESIDWEQIYLKLSFEEWALAQGDAHFKQLIIKLHRAHYLYNAVQSALPDDWLRKLYECEYDEALIAFKKYLENGQVARGAAFAQRVEELSKAAFLPVARAQ